MEEQFSVVDIEATQPDEEKTIERTYTQECKEQFSISDLKREIENNNSQIDSLNARNDEITAKINNAVGGAKLDSKIAIAVTPLKVK